MITKITDERLKELIEWCPAHEIYLLSALNELQSLRGQKKALIEDGERLFHSLCAYLDYCQCADIKYKCYDPVGAIEHHRALLKDLEC